MAINKIPNIVFKIRNNGAFEEVTSQELFQNKKAVVFALPGAFTPTCSEQQLPGFENMAQQFYDLGVEDIYCLSVNDSFVMNAWAESQGLKEVHVLPDGSGLWTTYMGMDVAKDNVGFGVRSWRYAMLVNDMDIVNMFIEPGYGDNVMEDPYGESSPEKVYEYLKENGWGKKLELNLEDGVNSKEKLG